MNLCLTLCVCHIFARLPLPSFPTNIGIAAANNQNGTHNPRVVLTKVDDDDDESTVVKELYLANLLIVPVHSPLSPRTSVPLPQ